MINAKTETNSRNRRPLIINGILLVAVAGVMAFMLFPATEAVRVRNAFLLEPVKVTDFNWQPDQSPATFRLESREAPKNIQAGVRAILHAAPQSDWERALLLSQHLTRNAKGGGSIQGELGASYDFIVKKGKGYCADFTKVYLAMAHEAGIPARQWAFAFDGFGGHGHAIIEIYDRSQKKWMMLDVFNNIFAQDSSSGEILGAMEFREYLLGKRDNVAIRKAGEGRLGFPIESKLIDYYKRGVDQWYLWWANDVVTYNETPALVHARILGNSFEKLVAAIIGVHPTIQIVHTATNSDEVQRLERLRYTVTATIVVATLLSLSFMVLLVRYWRGR